MLVRAFATVLHRRDIWGPALACSLLLALVPAVGAALAAVPLVALLLSWDPSVTVALLPDPGAAGWAAVAVLVLTGILLWRRLDAVLIYASGAREGSAWAATRRSWGPVALLHLEAAAATLTVAALLAYALLAGRESAAGVEAVLLLGVVALVRAVIKVYVTLASRFVIFDGASHAQAWRRARDLVGRERTQIVMAWMTLAAAGACIWLLGPLATPVVRDTAYDYPAGSSYAVAWEASRLLIAVPLEALLLVVSSVVWTSVAWAPDIAGPVEPPPPSRRIRLLAGTTALIVLTNGIATATDVRHDQAVRSQEDLWERDEIEPEQALRPAPSPAAFDRYRVRAVLDGERLTWTTKITFHNDTGVELDQILLNVWPAAYTGDAEDMPLARDLLAADVEGRFASRISAGTLDVVSVDVGQDPAPFHLEGTGLEIELEEGLRAGAISHLQVTLEADLPDFPERFGRWEQMTLLGNWIPVIAPYTVGWRRDGFGDVGDPFVSSPADYRVQIEVDDDLGVVGSGRLTSIRRSGEERSWTFRASQSRDAAFAIAPFLRGVEMDAAGTTLRCWYQADTRRDIRPFCPDARDALSYYSSVFGPLPFDEVEVVATEGILGGMEHPGLVFVSRSPGGLEGVPLLGELFDHAGFKAASTRHVIAHELAHQWWYAAVGNDQVKEPWLDEALAEASARLWLRSRGEDRTWMMANLSDGKSIDRSAIRSSVDDFETNQEYLEAVYEGGSAALLRLRSSIGPRSFQELLARWYVTQRLSQGSVAEFLELVERVGGEEARDQLVSG